MVLEGLSLITHRNTVHTCEYTMVNCIILQKCYMLIEIKDKQMEVNGHPKPADVEAWTFFSSEAQRDSELRPSCLPFLWEVGSLETQRSPARASIPGESGGKPCIRRLFEEGGFGGWSLCYPVPVSMQSCSGGGWRCMPGFNPQLAIY